MANGFFEIINGCRLNKFVITAEVYDGWMLYNTATGGAIFIHYLDDLSAILDKLKNMFYYVPLAFNEVKWVDDLRDKVASISKKSIIQGFTILTTTDCNARCFYCYEKGHPRLYMTEKTAKDVAYFIVKMSSDTPVDIRWFGGEPLVNIGAINIICSSLRDHNKRFHSSMVSNGLLFSEPIIQKAKTEWSLKRVQITLDGTKDTYQKAKLYKNSKGNEYERVIDNIGELIKAGIHVSIRLNQDLYNTPDLLELSNFLEQKFKGNKLCSVYNSLLYDDNDYFDLQAEAERQKMFILLQDRLGGNGFLPSNLLNKKIRFRHCMADNDASVLISPNGNIGKCEHYTDTHFIGSIYDSNFDLIEIQRWKEQYQITSKCLKCPLYPQCVRIKMCPEEKESCSLIQCENKIDLIKQSLIKLHEAYAL